MQKIVVGIDGSEASKNALRWAVEDARVRGAEVVALHAYEEPMPGADAALAPPIAVEDEPARALLDAARDADLLVVGSHGHGLSGLFLGSVSLECARHAACPVLIFRSSE